MNIKNVVHALRTTITVHDTTKARLVKVRGKMERQNGKARDLEDVVNELIDCYERNAK